MKMSSVMQILMSGPHWTVVITWPLELTRLTSWVVLRCISTYQPTNSGPSGLVLSAADGYVFASTFHQTVEIQDVTECGIGNTILVREDTRRCCTYILKLAFFNFIECTIVRCKALCDRKF